MICPMCLEPQDGAVLGLCCGVKFGPPWAIAALEAIEPRFVVLAPDGRRAAQVHDFDDEGEVIKGSGEAPFWDEALFNLFSSIEDAQVAQNSLGGDIIALVQLSK
jgi:hypothetical protein